MFEGTVVNVLPVVAGVEAAVSVNASASGSPADTVKVISVFSFPDAVAGAVTVGGRSTLVTVRVVLADPVSAFEAVKSTLYVPALEKLGVHVHVADVCDALIAKVLPVVAGALVVLSDGIVSPS